MNENLNEIQTETITTAPRGKLLRRIGAIALTVVMVCGLITGAVFAAGPTAEQTGLVYTAAKNNEPMTAAEVYAATVNSTVGITTSGTTNVFGYESVTAASGSGFIITEDGYILTNYHVIEGSDSITVTMYDGSSYDAELIGYDQSNDVAVLKIDASGLTPVTFGDSDKLVVGQDVLAIGNPLGELTFSLTTGVVSALDREITLSGSLRMKLIQTDCAINSGNSGGALFNMYGEVVGITNAKYSSSGYEASVDNIGFAIPVNTVTGIVEQIMTDGEISSPYIGLSVSDVDESLLDYGIPAGAEVHAVTEDSPAAEAGLEENDIITAANGETITGSGDLVDFIRACQAGDKVELTVYRKGETITLTVTVSENVKSALPEPEETENENAGEPQGEPWQGEQSITIPGGMDIEDFFGQMFPFGYN